MRYCGLGVVVLAVLGLSGCLEFGEDVEVSGAGFDAAKMAEVSRLTGVAFPSGAVGTDYLYWGSGIDRALGARVVIPEAEREAFLQNPIFVQGEDKPALSQIGRHRPWWRLETMSDRVDRAMQLPQGKYVEATLGREGDEWVVYLTWFET